MVLLDDLFLEKNISTPSFKAKVDNKNLLEQPIPIGEARSNIEDGLERLTSHNSIEDFFDLPRTTSVDAYDGRKVARTTTKK